MAEKPAGAPQPFVMFRDVKITTCPHVPSDTFIVGPVVCLDCEGTGHGFLFPKDAERYRVAVNVG